MPQTLEPVRTIYTEDWVRAQDDLDTLAERMRVSPFRRALARLEEGWEDVRPIGVWCEMRAREFDVAEVEAALLCYVELEIVDLFRWITGETTRCIPRPGQRMITASVDDLETEIDALQRNARVFLLAADSDDAPDTARALAREHAVSLIAWCSKFADDVELIRTLLDAARIREAG